MVLAEALDDAGEVPAPGFGIPGGTKETVGRAFRLGASRARGANDGDALVIRGLQACPVVFSIRALHSLIPDHRVLYSASLT